MGLQSEDLQFWHMLHVVLSAVLHTSPCFSQAMKKSLNQLIISLAQNKGVGGSTGKAHTAAERAAALAEL